MKAIYEKSWKKRLKKNGAIYHMFTLGSYCHWNIKNSPAKRVTISTKLLHVSKNSYYDLPENENGS